jgi:hypothetical protein
MKLSRLLAASAIASLLAACSGGMQSVPNTRTLGALPVSQSHTMALENGSVAHVMFSRDYTGTSSTFTDPAHFAPMASSSGGNLAYGGGPVQTVPHIFVVYWGPKWATSDTEYTTLNGFYGAIGGGGWINIDTQYYQTLGGTTTYISNPKGQLTATWIDTSSIPSRPSSSSVGAEAQKAEQHFASLGYAYSINNNYVVALQTGSDPSGFKTRWCAWHSSESESEGSLAYTDFPYQTDAGSSCGANFNGLGEYAGVTIVGGHEEAEAQTDPTPSNGWVDSGGSEIGDKCAWNSMTADNSAAGGYPTQPLWDNKISGCAMSGP